MQVRGEATLKYPSVSLVIEGESIWTAGLVEKTGTETDVSGHVQAGGKPGILNYIT